MQGSDSPSEADVEGAQSRSSASADAQSTERQMILRYPRRAALPILFGAFMFMIQIPFVPRTNGYHTLRYTIGFVVIALLLVWAARFLGNPTYLLITPEAVHRKSLIGTAQRPVRISGFSDLTIDSDTLFRRSDDRKIASLGSFKARPDDVADLETYLDTAAGDLV